MSESNQQTVRDRTSNRAAPGIDRRGSRLSPGTFSFPVVVRELRVQARRAATHWTRVCVGLFAGIVGLNILASTARGLTPSQGGQHLLQALGWGAFVFCIVEGLRQTADSLSEERREGTLGLLFLTDLQGLDVVLGKLASRTLGLFYGLLAAFPIMGLAISAGGVTAGEFWRTQLVLVHALFLACACGLWVSARAREEQSAFLRALGLGFVLLILPALLTAIPLCRSWLNPSPAAILGFARDTAYQTGALRFWASLATAQALGWILLVGAGKTLGLRWREDRPDTASAPPKPEAPRTAGYRIPPSLHAGPAPGSSEQRDRDPAAWLAARRPPKRLLIWVALLLPLLSAGSLSILYGLLGARSGGALVGFSFGSQLATGLVPALLLSLVATRRFADARRNGALELLLGTPLTDHAIVQGEWRALWRHVRLPFLVLAALSLLPLLYWFPTTQSLATGSRLWMAFMAGRQLAPLCDALGTLWMGLWLGLRARNAGSAVGQTLLWIVVLPWGAGAVASIVSLSIANAAGVPALSSSLPLVMYLGWGLFYPLGLALWARRQLHTRLRTVASGR
ncbi:MAG TPA: ABC transporter permease subunit [Verrucomicrobiota bacterium]|nr:ABC transporter permease subunit [Verrucomicrobiota bacterium]